MSNSSHSTFDVNWHAFQLNPNGSKEGKSKVEMYMQKFGMSKDKVMQMAGFPPSYHHRQLVLTITIRVVIIATLQTKWEPTLLVSAYRIPSPARRQHLPYINCRDAV